MVPPQADLTHLTHLCWGCNLKVHLHILCGMSSVDAYNLDDLGHVDIDFNLSNGKLIAGEDENKKRLICFACIALLASAAATGTLE